MYSILLFEAGRVFVSFYFISSFDHNHTHTHRHTHAHTLLEDGYIASSSSSFRSFDVHHIHFIYFRSSFLAYFFFMLFAFIVPRTHHSHATTQRSHVELLLIGDIRCLLGTDTFTFYLGFTLVVEW